MQDHMLTLYTWARGWPFAHILELGVCKGNSTCSFLAALEIDRRGCLWSIDIGNPIVPEEWHELDYWQFLKAHDLSSRAQDWAPAELDVLFVDAEHDYGSCKAELDLWVPRVRAGGVVLCHDTDPVETSGPAGALNAYCEEHPELSWRNIAGCQGLGVMRIR
jgi:predicted O-methyltransferase YrrM